MIPRGWAGPTPCVTAVDCLDTVAAAAIAVSLGTRLLHPVTATDRWVADLQTLDILSEGPAAKAMSIGLPVIADPIDAKGESWPVYLATACDARLTAAAAYPLTLSDRPLGVLTLYRRDAEIRPSRSEQLEVGLLAEFALAGLLADIHQPGDAPSPRQRDSGAHLAAAARYLTRLHRGHDEAAQGGRPIVLSSWP